MSTFGGSPVQSLAESGSFREGFYRTPKPLRSFTRTSTTPPRVRSPLPPTSSLLSLATARPVSEGYAKPVRGVGGHVVTVFGFPQDRRVDVLDRFRFGEVEEEVDGTGNWVDIAYRREEDAKKALGMNGAMIAGGVMIGVRSKREEELTERVAAQPPEMDDLLVRSQYYRRSVRQAPSFWDKFLEHFLNWD